MSIIGESCLLSCPISSIMATTPWSLDTSHQQIFRAVVLLKQRCYDSLLAGDEKSVTTDAVWSTLYSRSSLKKYFPTVFLGVSCDQAWVLNRCVNHFISRPGARLYQVSREIDLTLFNRQVFRCGFSPELWITGCWKSQEKLFCSTKMLTKVSLQEIVT